jgi:hypothetical protein
MSKTQARLAALIRECRFRYKTSPSVPVLRLCNVAEAVAAELERVTAARDEAVSLLRAVVKAADDDARMGYPLPGESCVYVVLALAVDEFLAGAARAAQEGER